MFKHVAFLLKLGRVQKATVTSKDYIKLYFHGLHSTQCFMSLEVVKTEHRQAAAFHGRVPFQKCFKSKFFWGVSSPNSARLLYLANNLLFAAL